MVLVFMVVLGISQIVTYFNRPFRLTYLYTMAFLHILSETEVCSYNCSLLLCWYRLYVSNHQAKLK